MVFEEIKAFARKTKGCDIMRTPFKWYGYDVYIRDEHGLPPAPEGLAFMFLVRGNKIKVSTPEEAYEFARDHRRWIDKQFRVQS